MPNGHHYTFQQGTTTQYTLITIVLTLSPARIAI
jgi:hypothetical protein